MAKVAICESGFQRLKLGKRRIFLPDFLLCLLWTTLLVPRYRLASEPAPIFLPENVKRKYIESKCQSVTKNMCLIVLSESDETLGKFLSDPTLVHRYKQKMT